eukprot:CAMPEP_0181184278 /NCGR_PEP_ID=MMETSP1096-20121128/8879_1 /TAXON_ID=156174 ORGANISM="Chrysochromulina ericina, Strain CCMP281" /NCGR_SAMPLE_ID=MMETSP1096 /ASSEMBLY_ACC=CAM_ASM_000453 /LENGTH=109 /DNA_ID=CAMNT_0023273025 /DNA_START=472 /DNA_END=801 /DNA_ORIENTATION=-
MFTAQSYPMHPISPAQQLPSSPPPRAPASPRLLAPPRASSRLLAPPRPPTWRIASDYAWLLLYAPEPQPAVLLAPTQQPPPIGGEGHRADPAVARCDFFKQGAPPHVED